jgi:hypothetical protein
MEQIKKPVSLKIKSDTEEELNRERMREIQAKYSRKRIAARERKKELRRGEAARDNRAGDFFGEGTAYIFLALGLTISLVNDFFDLIMWNKVFLLAQTLDMVALFLLLFVLAFAQRSFMSLTAIVFVAFGLEILPVAGVAPWWTIAVVIWYGIGRRGE